MDCEYIHIVDDKLGLNWYCFVRKRVKSPVEKSNDIWYECVSGAGIKVLPLSYLKDHVK